MRLFLGVVVPFVHSYVGVVFSGKGDGGPQGSGQQVDDESSPDRFLINVTGVRRFTAHQSLPDLSICALGSGDRQIRLLPGPRIRSCCTHQPEHFLRDAIHVYGERRTTIHDNSEPDFLRKIDLSRFWCFDSLRLSGYQNSNLGRNLLFYLIPMKTEPSEKNRKRSLRRITGHLDFHC